MCDHFPVTRTALVAAFAVLTTVSCANTRVRDALAKQTESFVLAKPIAEAWPVVKQVLEDRHFPGSPSPNKPFHLETAILTSEGGFPTASVTPGGAAPQGAAGGRGGRGGSRSVAIDHVGGELMRFVADGEAVDDTHCKVRIVRYLRDNIDASENDVRRDVGMEFEVISRLEPERAAEIRKALAADGIELP
jgi:hypothetical protein